MVIGASHKRNKERSEEGRPLIGEKGLGRLSSFALGKSVEITSSRGTGAGFTASVDWEQMRQANSLEEYGVDIVKAKVSRGTRVEIRDLNVQWSDSHTDFLVTHAQFLASVPGQRFSIALRVNGKPHSMVDPLATVSRLAEAEMEMEVASDGSPLVKMCKVKEIDETNIVFRDMKDGEKDKSLAGMRLSLKFFLRNDATRRLGGVLERNEVAAVLERYQGIRIYRNGINVPPYGLNRDDWASLEKQRTATGGPTMVPGNSQLIGEVHIDRKRHPQLVVTAGRSGFSDQAAVGALAAYVRWAVRELGTARRAQRLGIRDGQTAVPQRVDLFRGVERDSAERVARDSIAQLVNLRIVKRDPVLRSEVEAASRAVEEVLANSEQSLRLYAQLASTGIAATSFAHELRAEFDVVSEGITELASLKKKPDADLIDLLKGAWKRISVFAALFRIVPVKLRRQRNLISSTDLRRSAETILGLAPLDKVKLEIDVPKVQFRMVPAELDSILLNLVSNAVKAVAESAHREVGRIRVAFRVDKSDLEVLVADNGCGVTPKIAKIMFEPLEGRFSEGTGMGLPIVKYIAERYNGDVMLSAAPPRGFVTEMVVRLKSVVIER